MESDTPTSNRLQQPVRRSPRLHNTLSPPSTKGSPISSHCSETVPSPNTTLSCSSTNSSPLRRDNDGTSTAASISLSAPVPAVDVSVSGGSSSYVAVERASGSCTGGNSASPITNQSDSSGSQRCSNTRSSPRQNSHSAHKQKKRQQFSQPILEDPFQVCDDVSRQRRGPTAVVFDDRFLLHENPWKQHHSESPQRLRSILKQCEEWGLLSQCLRVPARLASQDELLLAHSAEYIETIRGLSETYDLERAKTFCLPHDVFINESSFNAAALAVGSAVDLVDKIIDNDVQNAFLFARPPGHHALNDCASGYCLFNQAAIAARRAIDREQRVLVVDWDVHYGQGTQAILAPYQQAFCFSVHRYEQGQFWPHLSEADCDRVSGVGGDGRRGCTICNVPLNTVGVADSDMMAVWNRLLLPMAYEFSPDLVIVSAGFDMALGDPKGEMCVTPACFGHLTHSLQALAGGRVLCILEGGYNLQATSLSAAHTLRSLLGHSPAPLTPSVSAVNASVEFSITNAIYHHRERFHCLSIYPVYDADVDLRKHHLLTKVPLADSHWPLADSGQLPSTDDKLSAEMISLRLGSEVAPSSGRDFKPVGLFTDERMLLHRNVTDPGHPECPARVSSIMCQLKSWGLADRCEVVSRCQPASASQLMAVHSERHVQDMADTPAAQQNQLNQLARGYNSVYLCTDSYQAALLSAGSVIQAVDGVMSGELRHAMCVCRPPGHHAERDCAHGFCMFNSVAVAARHAIDHHQLDRVLIIDWDIHHGNGIQHAFYSDNRVLYISLHRYDQATFFPCSEDAAAECVGTSDPDALGYNVNIAWNGRRLRGEEYLSAFLAVVLPVINQWQPQLVLVASGFDAARGDPIGGYHVLPQVYGHLTHHLLRAAGGRVVLALEGGYSLSAISYACCMCVKALLGDPLVQLDQWQQLRPSAVGSLALAMSVQRRYWPSIAAVTALPRQSLKQLQSIERKMASEAVAPADSDAVADMMARISLNGTDSADCQHSSARDDQVECASASARGDQVECASARGDQVECASARGDQVECASARGDQVECASARGDQMECAAARGDQMECASARGDQVECASASARDDQVECALARDDQVECALARDDQVLSMYAVVPLPDCPHLTASVLPLPEHGIDTARTCLSCATAVENWSCLTCYQVFCGRYGGGHMVDHYEASGHAMALSLADLSVWCYVCDSYVHNELLLPAKQSAHRHKFCQDMPS